MSVKPVIYAANVSEYDLKDGNDYTKQVKEYASKDKRFVLLENEDNCGQGVARNKALEIAKKLVDISLEHMK